MSKQYQSVSCQMHSELELVIMHKQRLKVQIQSQNTLTEIMVRPYDIVSRAGQGEFLLAVNQEGEKTEYRLDQLKSFEVINK